LRTDKDPDIATRPSNSENPNIAFRSSSESERSGQSV
jgi:hypothetical protein